MRDVIRARLLTIAQSSRDVQVRFRIRPEPPNWRLHTRASSGDTPERAAVTSDTRRVTGIN